MTTASEEVRAFFDYHFWATNQLIDHLEKLSGEQLEAQVPGTYGSMIRTLTHLVDADERYLMRLDHPDPPRNDRETQPLHELRDRVADHRDRWNAILDRLDAGSLEARIERRENYPETTHAEGLLLLQAIHHGNDHRTQICSTLGALGLDVPEIDGWEYWRVERNA